MATLKAKVDILEERITMVIEKRTTPAVVTEGYIEQVVEGWKEHIIQQLKIGKGVLKEIELEPFIVLK